MVKNGEDQEDDHQNQRSDGTVAGGCSNGEQTDNADFGNVKTHENVLQSQWIASALGVNSNVLGEQEVVSESKVEKVETNGGEQEHKRGDNGVAKGYSRVS